MLVNFMIIGAQKCGTTTLAEQLALHPQICFCKTKEPCYFNRVSDWRAELAAYHNLYTPKPGQLCGEASTTYTFLPEWAETHERLYEYNPQLKLIYIMRHPVERVISNYAHRLVRSTVRVDPGQAVFADPVYLNRSRYGVQLRPYFNLFGREQVMLLLFEEYIANPTVHLRAIAQFLGIAEDGFGDEDQPVRAANQSVGQYHLNPTLEKLKQNRLLKVATEQVSPALRQLMKRYMGKRLETKPTFTPELKQMLWRFLEDDVCAVEEYMGRHLAVWRQGYDQ